MQLINTLIMYMYLRYYDYRLRSDSHFRILELYKALQEQMLKDKKAARIKRKQKNKEVAWK